jgi:hypothetical protein
VAIKRKNMIIEPGKKHSFRDISSNNTDTLVLLLYQRSKPRTLSPAARLLLTQSQQGDLVGQHLRISNVLDPVVNRFTRQTIPTVNRKHFFKNIFCIESIRPQKKNAQQDAPLR